MNRFESLKDGIDRARALQAQAVAKGASAVSGEPDAAGRAPGAPADPAHENLMPASATRAEGTDETAQRPGGLA